MARIFISYSRVDRQFTEQLAKRLRRVYGSDEVWFDDNLRGGENWWNEILAQIAQCDVFIYLLTRESVKSAYCRAEWAEARRLRKHILPALIRARTPIPDDLRDIQHVDMSAGITVDNMTELQAAITRLFSRVPPTPPTPLSPDPVPLPVTAAPPKRALTAMLPRILAGLGLVAVLVIGVLVIRGSGVFNPTGVPQFSSETPANTSESGGIDTSAPTVRPTDTSSPTLTLLDTPMATFVRGVNVRAGPDTLFNPPIGSFEANATAEILGVTPAGDWYKVRYDNGTGWVAASLLTISGDSSRILVDAGPPVPTLTPVEGRGQIAFRSNREGNEEIYVMDASGGNVRNLTNHDADDAAPAWSPDGTQIAFGSNRDGNEEIYVMDANGRNLRNLTNHSADDGAPAWSPDGTRIAFRSNRDGNWEVYVMDTNGGNVRNLTNRGIVWDDWPVWSPDGTQIAFGSNRDGDWEIYVMDTNGGNVRNLTNHNAADYGPAWPPDGTRIAFTSDRDTNNEIYIMDTNGGNIRNLSNHSADDELPAWSPDGTQLAFRSNRDGNWEIYVMDTSGGNVRNLSNHSAADSEPAWQP